jgi:hypothetical protein
MRDRDAAQARANRIRAFRAELGALDAEGVVALSDQQRAAIATHHDQLLGRLAVDYDVDATDAAQGLSRGMQLASFFAAVTLTAAVAALVERFWARLDLPLQATLLCAFPLIALGGVELAARRERTLYVASLFALVAYGTFWLAIVVLSDTLNIPLSPPWIWGAVFFGLGLSLPYRFRLILAVTLATLIVAIAATVFQAEGHPWTAIFEQFDLLMVAAFASTLVAPYLGQLYRSFAPITRLVGFAIGLVALLIVSTFGGASLLPLGNRTTELVYQAIMLVVCVVLIAAGIRKRWTESVYLATGALTVFLIVRYIDWFWDAVPSYIFFAILAAIAFAWLLVLRRVRSRLGKTGTPGDRGGLQSK